MNNTELNNAIYTVLTTKYKKDARDAFKMVKDAGYVVGKRDGYFYVKNPKSDKVIFVWDYHWDYETRDYNYYIIFSYRNEKRRLTHKFDLVNCLNTPINTTYRQLREMNWHYDPYGYKAKMKKVNYAKRWYNNRTENVQRILNKIDELQKELVDAVAYRENALAELNEVKKECGLKTR